jgi:hypothetical protein
MKKKRTRKSHAPAPFPPEHASLLSDLIATWLGAADLPPSAVVAAFILAALSLKHGRSWAVGPYAPPSPPPPPPPPPPPSPPTLPSAPSPAARDDTTKDTITPTQTAVGTTIITIGSVPGLCDVLSPYPRKLLEWCSPDGADSRATTLADLSLRRVFATCRLRHQKPCVRTAIVGWLDDARPLVLMHTIPSPTQVLEMQSAGRRVCTLFLRPAELGALHTSELAYLSERGTLHTRDALEFLTHDLSHMELFWGDTYEEQAGFFAAMRHLDPTGEGRPWRFFRQFHGKEEMQALWPRLQYVFSDMNCWATHLMGYLKAKWRVFEGVQEGGGAKEEEEGGGAEVEESEEGKGGGGGGGGGGGQGGFAAGWPRLLDSIGLEGEAREAAERLCGNGAKMNPRQGEALRDFFKSYRGRRERERGGRGGR